MNKITLNHMDRYRIESFISTMTNIDFYENYKRLQNLGVNGNAYQVYTSVIVEKEKKKRDLEKYKIRIGFNLSQFKTQ